MVHDIDLDQLVPIYPAWYMPWWRTPIFYVVLVCGTLLLAAGVLYRYKRRRTPHALADVALQRLGKLQATVDMQYEFYCQLTALLKWYLSERYGLMLTSATDDELVQALADTHINPEIQATIKELFCAAARVRFAHEYSDQKQIEHTMAQSYTIIIQTAPVADV